MCIRDRFYTSGAASSTGSYQFTPSTGSNSDIFYNVNKPGGPVVLTSTPLPAQTEMDDHIPATVQEMHSGTKTTFTVKFDVETTQNEVIIFWQSGEKRIPINI